MASSRRSASDINILAMLDGLGSRPHAKRNLLWYGAGGVLACGLIGLLAWLVHEPATRLDSTMVSSGVPPAPPMPIERIAETRPAPVPLQATVPLQAAVPLQAGATIVNVADEPTPAAPPLALAASAADRPPHTLAAPNAAPAQHAPAPKSPAVHVAPARAAVAVIHPRATHANPKRGAPAIKPVPAPATVDTDVALISAIIQHAANQRDAAEASGCGEKPCGPRMPQQP